VPLFGGCVNEPKPPADAIWVGALLPFTGSASATGSNIERALLQAAEEINAAGGVDGRPLWIDARDTHSDVDRGLAAAVELFDEGVVGLIGPQDGALARRLLPLLLTKQVVTISGGTSLPPFQAFSGGGYFFRISPSVGDFANVLATQMSRDGVQRFAVVNYDDDFNASFAAITGQQLATLGGQEVVAQSISAGDMNLDGVIGAVSRAAPDAIVLAAPADAAAEFVQSWNAAQSATRFYFPPPLRSNLFIKNTPTNTLEGSQGVAPTVSADAPSYATSFSQRWGGDVPSSDASYARDALALFALAAQAASTQSGGTLSGPAIKDQVAAVSYTPGAEYIGWNELARGLTILRSGQPVNYRGVSGPVDIVNGLIVPGLIQVWRVESNQIVDGDTLPSSYCMTQYCM
jgi:branched-chain amino acid transport system substrate-binding protein